MANLSEPSREVATSLLRRVSYDERLMGFKLNAMAGQVPQELYSLEDAVHFLHVDPFELLLGPGGQGQVRYVDLPLLSRWVAEVLGDGELAEAIREAAAQEEVYGKQVGPVRDLLAQRLQQCLAATAEPKEADREETEA